MLFRRTSFRKARFLNNTTMSKRHLESYSHRYAKTTVGSWLNKKIKTNSNWILEDIPSVSKDAKVFYEYPICKNKNKEIIGLINTSKDSNDIWNNYLGNNNKYLPNYKNFKQLELIPMCIFDVAVVDEGKVKLVFEIKYKNPVSDKKKKKIQKYKQLCGVNCYEISALTILDQVRPPKKIDFVTL